MTNTWNYPADLSDELGGHDLDGYDVEATDGKIGTIDEHSAVAGAGYLIVDTGFWIFGKRRLIPAGVVRSVDPTERKVHVTMTKEQIKSAPDFDDESRDDSDWFRASAGNYYDPFAW
jgi:hypothetical protein